MQFFISFLKTPCIWVDVVWIMSCLASFTFWFIPFAFTSSSLLWLTSIPHMDTQAFPFLVQLVLIMVSSIFWFSRTRLLWTFFFFCMNLFPLGKCLKAKLVHQWSWYLFNCIKNSQTNFKKCCQLTFLTTRPGSLCWPAIQQLITHYFYRVIPHCDFHSHCPPGLMKISFHWQLTTHTIFWIRSFIYCVVGLINLKELFINSENV